MAKSKNTDESIEGKLISIDSIIDQLESGELTLEQSLKLFTDGTKLIHDCRNILDHTAKQITEMTQAQHNESHEPVKAKDTPPSFDSFDDGFPF